MNNKGFTLIELLVTIALIAALSVTIGLNMSGMLSRQKEKEIKNYEKQIADAACVYATIENKKTSTTVSIEYLLENGYLKNDLINPNTKNPITKEKERTVDITWNNNEKECTYTAEPNSES